MQHQGELFTPTEWKLMECLWEKGDCTGREAVEDMARRAGWSRSTTLTLLRRMTEKGAIDCREEGGVKVYRANVERSDAARRETEDFLHRVYRGSVSMMVSAFTEEKGLSREERDELYALLRRMEEEQ
ncbi:MAG: BlaI/MecI/CopY family transcriptional regulator [Oscillospiraceae bacterium]|nr:BlaI/MecI/CopY family transcriptional regulator [Oscillospiraceae bacterium]